MRCAICRVCVVFGAILMPIACGDDDAPAGTVTVHFGHEVAGQALEFDNRSYTNAAGNVYTVTHLEYIVSNIDLVRGDGATYRLGDEHYRDARRSSTASLMAVNVPGGQYSALRFTFGVASDRTLPNTSDFNNMAWPSGMGGGHHYMRLEGLYTDADETLALLSHTGPSGGEDFTYEVELPLSLSVDGDAKDIHVFMDLNQWYEDPHVYDFVGRGMIMGNADAQLTHQANGASVFRIGTADDAKAVGGTQSPTDVDDEYGDDGHGHRSLGMVALA